MGSTGRAASRGRPRRVDRERIIQVAKELDPATLTMQAIADEMGVDRKTLHYHVGDRTSLLRMVAADAFRDALRLHEVAPSKEWQEVVTSFARVTRDAALATGAWAGFVDIETEEDLQAARPAEVAVEALVGAGLSEPDAGRAVALLAVLAFSSARDRSVSGADRHPQEPVLQSALARAPDAPFPVLRRLLGARSPSLGSTQHFDFSVSLVVSGIESLLERRRSSRA